MWCIYLEGFASIECSMVLSMCILSIFAIWCSDLWFLTLRLFSTNYWCCAHTFWLLCFVLFVRWKLNRGLECLPFLFKNKNIFALFRSWGCPIFETTLILCANWSCGRDVNFPYKNWDWFWEEGFTEGEGEGQGQGERGEVSIMTWVLN